MFFRRISSFSFNVSHVIFRIIKLKDVNNYLQNNYDVEMTKFSLECIALVGLGTRLGCMEDNLPKDHPAVQLMECVKDSLDLSFKYGLMPKFLRKLNTRIFNRIMALFDTQWE